jgi:UDP:flavonoid glycosyltransferase YjiC (YdhE family)
MVSDQPYNARVLEALGGGLSLPARDVSVARVTAAMARILEDKSIARGAQELSRRMREKEGGRKVVELLVDVADTK